MMHRSVILRNGEIVFSTQTVLRSFEADHGSSIPKSYCTVITSSGATGSSAFCTCTFEDTDCVEAHYVEYACLAQL
jgi:hypothetical protein